MSFGPRKQLLLDLAKNSTEIQELEAQIKEKSAAISRLKTEEKAAELAVIQQTKKDVAEKNRELTALRNEFIEHYRGLTPEGRAELVMKSPISREEKLELMIHLVKPTVFDILDNEGVPRLDKVRVLGRIFGSKAFDSSIMQLLAQDEELGGRLNELLDELTPEERTVFTEDDGIIHNWSQAKAKTLGLQGWDISRLGFKRSFSGLCDGWDDSQLMQLGLRFWNFSQRQYAELHGRPAEVGEMQDGIRMLISDLYGQSPQAEAKGMVAERFAVFAGTWAVHAFQKILTSHTYAAALMCTDATREVLTDIVLPWQAFMVVVPNGVLTVKAEEVNIERTGVIDYTRLLVTVMADGNAYLVLYDPSHEKNHGIISHAHRTIADLLFEEAGDSYGAEGRHKTPPATQRVLKMAKRLIAGLLLAMQNVDNMKSRQVPARRGEKKRGCGEPAHRITIVGRPLRIDLREHVREYMRGERKHAPPSVQVLVRGHFKRQVVGVGRSGRKVIWVEPYWRGPEDAPILTRPKLVS